MGCHEKAAALKTGVGQPFDRTDPCRLDCPAPFTESVVVVTVAQCEVGSRSQRDLLNESRGLELAYYPVDGRQPQPRDEASRLVPEDLARGQVATRQ